MSCELKILSLLPRPIRDLRTEMCVMHTDGNVIIFHAFSQLISLLFVPLAG